MFHQAYRKPCIIWCLPKAHGFTTPTLPGLPKFKWTETDVLFHQKYSNLFLYFKLESLSTWMVSSNEWAYWHPFQGSQVAPRRQSPSSEHSSYRSLTQHAHPCDMLTLWATAAENPPDGSSEYCEIPSPRMWDSACLLSQPLMPWGTIIKVPRGVGRGTMIKIPGRRRGKCHLPENCMIWGRGWHTSRRAWCPFKNPTGMGTHSIKLHFDH